MSLTGQCLCGIITYELKKPTYDDRSLSLQELSATGGYSIFDSCGSCENRLRLTLRENENL